MKKNDILTGIVSGYGSEGEGIIKNGEYTFFIPFAMPGEKVRFRVLKVQKNIAFAKVEEILTPQEGRARPKCPVFGKCGGCQLMHMEYSQQLTFKNQLISNCFQKIGFLNVTPHKIIASVNQLHYRNKLQLPVRQTENGAEVGFFAINSHRVVPINDCFIHGEWCKNVIEALKTYIKDKNIIPYNELTGEGILRHIIVKKVGLEYIVVLVVNGNDIKDIKYFDKLLSKALDAQYSLFLNINTRRDNVIVTDNYRLLKGKGFVSDTFLGVKYTIGPASFMQVNDYIKTRLYQKVNELVPENSNVIDAYCGAGLLTSVLAKKSRKVTGIEIVPEAIDCANQVAMDNGIKNVQFICGPCEEVLPKIIKKEKDAVVVLDPPRKGLDRKVTEAVLSVRPKHIIYVSCSPQTLARDIGLLTGTLHYEENNLKKNVSSPVNGDEKAVLPNNYYIDYLCGYDMFSQCKGVETICSLIRKD